MNIILFRVTNILKTVFNFHQHFEKKIKKINVIPHWKIKKKKKQRYNIFSKSFFFWGGKNTPIFPVFF